MPIHVSPGNSKLGNIPNISLTPGRSCGIDIPCLKSCYAMRIYRRFPKSRDAWDDNCDMAIHSPTIFFDHLDDWIMHNKPKLFRFHVAGDILSNRYFERMAQLCRHNSNVSFLTYTKMFGIINANKDIIPPNLSVVLSMWPGFSSLQIRQSMEDLKDFRKAWLLLDKNRASAGCTATTVKEYRKMLPQAYFKCQGKCHTCKMCWHAVKLGVDVGFKLH